MPTLAISRDIVTKRLRHPQPNEREDLTRTRQPVVVVPRSAVVIGFLLFESNPLVCAQFAVKLPDGEKNQPMPIDLLAIGVANVVGLVFKPILEDFAKDVLKDSTKDYVKGCFGSVFSSLRKEPLERALGKALRELLQLIQNELLACGLTEEELEERIPQVKEFTRSEGLQQALRQLFTESDSRVDPSLFARSWEPFASGRPLPKGFSWQRIAAPFTRSVRSLRQQDAELREILNSQTGREIVDLLSQQAGLAPDSISTRIARRCSSDTPISTFKRSIRPAHITAT